ncbi:hypothetical protein ADUPG1_009731 [Aduncisulcus paluster]|uniref:Bromo domain-containing protein n=1 Tax=Aduncisulcus paluster TaxID=2918883 RepID=A0ABQ5L0F6_9EUKA|nr:hypothetical protein ADUPG1_009731 [Aduncisulcus paluster]
MTLSYYLFYPSYDEDNQPSVYLFTLDSERNYLLSSGDAEGCSDSSTDEVLTIAEYPFLEDPHLRFSWESKENLSIILQEGVSNPSSINIDGKSIPIDKEKGVVLDKESLDKNPCIISFFNHQNHEKSCILISNSLNEPDKEYCDMLYESLLFVPKPIATEKEEESSAHRGTRRSTSTKRPVRHMSIEETTRSLSKYSTEQKSLIQQARKELSVPIRIKLYRKIRDIMALDDAIEFRKPVYERYPDIREMYISQISHPMDLRLLGDKVMCRDCRYLGELVFLSELIWKNSIAFTPEHHMKELAEMLRDRLIEAFVSIKELGISKKQYMLLTKQTDDILRPRKRKEAKNSLKKEKK